MHVLCANSPHRRQASEGREQGPHAAVALATGLTDTQKRVRSPSLQSLRSDASLVNFGVSKQFWTIPFTKTRDILAVLILNSEI